MGSLVAAGVAAVTAFVVSACQNQPGEGSGHWVSSTADGPGRWVRDSSCQASRVSSVDMGWLGRSLRQSVARFAGIPPIFVNHK